MRIFGFVFLVVLGVANLVNLSLLFILLFLTPVIKLLKRRLPPRNVGGSIVNLKAFRSASYSVYCLSSFSVFLGLYTRQSIWGMLRSSECLKFF